ncbi:MAG: ABC transporter ATP-binding protein/permease [Acholeplasmatales bacterium]|nr:ABC transporter ATP-binding protein/permease [Acholeplasmatales bacterium]
MLKLENVSKYYSNENSVYKGITNVSLELNRGEFVAITGESGSGKSTLLNVLTKMDSFDDGEIYYMGNETSYFKIDDMEFFRKNKVGFIFQNYNIIDSYTVLENVMMPLLINGVKPKDAKQKATDIITKVGLFDRIHNRGTNLSGGEKQRCVIARALASDCEILACDEPTGNLDKETSKEIIKLIAEVAKDKLVLIVTHDYDEVADIVTRKITMFDGKVIEDFYLKDFKGEPEETPLELEYVPVKRKIDFLIAFKNLVSTPKKTVFSFLVFLSIALITILLFCFINNNLSHPEAVNIFPYTGPNKLIVYNEDHSDIDENVLKKVSNDYAINNFYSTKTVTVVTTRNVLYSRAFNVYYEKTPDNLYVDAGRLPENDYELIMLSDTTRDSSFLGMTIVLSMNGTRTLTYDTEYKIVGTQRRKDIKGYTLTGSKLFEQDFKDSFFRIPEKNSQSSLTFETNITKVEYWQQASLKTQIITNEEVTKFNCYYQDYLLFDLNDIEVHKASEYPSLGLDENKTYFVKGPGFSSLVDKKIHEASVYGDKGTMIRLCNENGLSYIDVERYDTIPASERFMSNIISYSSIVASSLSFILLFYITYLVISRIYISKKATYGIYRTLGVAKKDMNRVVGFEILTVSLFAIILVYIVMFILGKTINNEFFIMFKHINVFISIWYFFILTILSLLLVRRFNRKLFSFTVSTTLRAGD